MTQKFLCVCIFFFANTVLQVLSLSFVRLSLGRATDIPTINWQNFAQVGLQTKFAFRIRLIVSEKAGIVHGFCPH